VREEEARQQREEERCKYSTMEKCVPTGACVILSSVGH